MKKSMSFISVCVSLVVAASAFGAFAATEKKATKDTVITAKAATAPAQTAPATATAAPAQAAPTTATAKTAAAPVQTTPTTPTDAEKKLAQESAAFCKTTAATKATPQMIIEKVKEACALIEKEGAKAFPQFEGKDSKFIFAGTYLWINNFDGILLMNPMAPQIVNKNNLELKDKNGKLFFAEMIKICKEKGDGWIDYYWPKAGEKEPSLKIGYVHKAKCDGKDMVVGCGVYGTTLDEVNKALAKK
jgi:cytochrome c